MVHTQTAMSTVPESPYGPLDLAVGWLIGWEDRPPLPALPPGAGLRSVVEALLEPAVATGGPVGIPLFGGSGSAVILGVANDLARRGGHELPVPLSLVLEGTELEGEYVYQQRIVEHFGLQDRWERVDARGELELLGPHARAALTANGVQFPANVFWARPLLARLGGGTFVVSHGVEELASWWPYRPLWETLRFRRRPSVAAAALGLLATLPPVARAAAVRRFRAAPSLPWLRPAAQAQLARATSELTPSPRWAKALPQMRRQRCHTQVPRSYAQTAAEFGVGTVFPWQTPEIAAWVLADSTSAGAPPVQEMLPRWFGDLVPPDLPFRRDRANYGGLFYGPATRAFGRDWSGAGLDESLVDPQVLRRLWASDEHDWRSAALMQTAWLHDQG